MSRDQSTIWLGDALPPDPWHRAMMRKAAPVAFPWAMSAIAIFVCVGIAVAAAQISIELKAIERATHAGDPH